MDTTPVSPNSEDAIPAQAVITVLHNPRCSTSRAALEAAESAGVALRVVQYLKEPLNAEQLTALLDKFEDEPGDLVRRDAHFAELGFTDADVVTREQVVSVLAAHPKLMQRPVLVRGDRAIIGRPKGRIPDFLSEA